MVKLHTWLPLDPHLLLDGLRPDAGHSAMEVLTDHDEALAYISFWPESGTLFGDLTQIIKPRPRRHPSTYAQEIDPLAGYMQRPSDYVDILEGLDEESIVELWAAIEDTKYDLMHWNCSNICKLLMLSSLDPKHRDRLIASAACSTDDMARIVGKENLLEKLRYLATSPFIDCRPEDVRRMAAAYMTLETSAEDCGIGSLTSTPVLGALDPAL